VARCSGRFAFGKWIVGDTKGGRLLYINSAAYDEFGDPLVMQIESGPVKHSRTERRSQGQTSISIPALASDGP
jgi:hypothetical protein